MFDPSTLCSIVHMEILSPVISLRYLVAAVGLQCLWSFSLAVVDAYALLVRRSLRNCSIVGLFTFGDAVRILCLLVCYTSKHI